MIMSALVKVMIFAVLLFSVILHEVAHGYTALRLGDPLCRLEEKGSVGIEAGFDEGRAGGRHLTLPSKSRSGHLHNHRAWLIRQGGRPGLVDGLRHTVGGLNQNPLLDNGTCDSLVVDILELLHAMDELAPGTAARHTLLYGVEVKFYSCRLRLSPDMETEIEGLFACGDGAGVTRGLVQASASGMVAGQAIRQRLAGVGRAGGDDSGS